MSNQIMKMGTLVQLQNELKCIHNNCFEQFVISVLRWYQYTAINATQKSFTQNDGLFIHEPPNVFDLFEYTNIEAETVINQFVLSDAHYLYEHQTEKNFLLARDDAENNFLAIYPETFEHMSFDVQKILNAYNLFYLFKDDTDLSGKYYNPFVKEIW